ncbi:MAG: hypothetical protein VYC42_06700 [Pseudomonadota bacterium]|nr:hypothetical protein [Pseudomonadota bacterium]
MPRKAERLVRRLTETIIPDVVGLRGLFAAIDADRASHEAIEQLGVRADQLLEAVLSAINPELWRQLRAPVREHWIARLRPGLPRIMSRIVRALQESPERYIDLSELAAAQVRDRPELIGEILWGTGRAEFRFIEWSGGVIGMLMGLCMAALWSAHPAVWLVSLGGAFVGGFTNWLAIRMVFAPVHPVRIGPWTVHGLVFRRQAEVSDLLASSVMERMIGFSGMLGHLSARSVLFRELHRDVIARELEETTGGAAALVTMALGARSREQAVAAMSAAMAREGPDLLGGITLGPENRTAVLDVLSGRLRALAPERYGRMMHFMVAEDEHLLVAAGVVLGGAAACLGGLTL